MGAGYIDVIKGNEGEIKTVFGDNELQQRGVDSSSTLDAAQKADLVQRLAGREKCVVVLTGKTDYVSDGGRTFCISNGNQLLGRVTGTGCCLGTTISAYVAVHPQDKLVAVVAGILHFEIAAELAISTAAAKNVRGPGTFVPAFIDELANLAEDTVKGDLGWLKLASVSRVS